MMQQFRPSTLHLGDTLPLGFDVGATTRWAANKAAVIATGYPMTGVYEHDGYTYYFVAPTRTVFLLKSPTKSYYPGGKPVAPNTSAYLAILNQLRQGTPLPESAAAAVLRGAAPGVKQDRSAPPAPSPSSAPLPPPPPTEQQLMAMAATQNAPSELPTWVPPAVVGAGMLVLLVGYFALRSPR